MAALAQFDGWTIGDQLRKARTTKGMKQEDLAKEIGRSRVTISHWENNKGMPRLKDARKIAAATDAPWFLGLIIDLRGETARIAHAA